MALFNIYQGTTAPTHAVTIDFSDFINDVKEKRVTEVLIRGSTISGNMSDNKTFQTYVPAHDAGLVERLLESGVRIKAAPSEEANMSFWQVLLSWFPMILLIGVWACYQ